jgi:hypothetical protein
LLHNRRLDEISFESERVFDDGNTK